MLFVSYLRKHEDALKVRGTMQNHLMRRGFMDGCTWWRSHSGEDEDEDVADQRSDEEAGHRYPEEEGMEHEEAGHEEAETDTRSTGGNFAGMAEDPHVQEPLVKEMINDRTALREAAKLATLGKDSKTPLYGSCNPKHTRLGVTLKFLDLKATHNSTNTSLDKTLKYLHEVLPMGNVLPTSIDEAKKVVCPFDLGVMRYHTCRNDCIIYRNQHAELTMCPECSAP